MLIAKGSKFGKQSAALTLACLVLGCNSTGSASNNTITGFDAAEIDLSNTPTSDNMIRPSEQNNTASAIDENERTKGVEIPVLFATDRRFSIGPDGARFDDRRDQRRDPHFGLNIVTVPSAIQTGRQGDFSFWRLTPNPVEGSVLLSRKSEVFSRQAWRSMLQSQINRSNKGAVLVFVHGYNNSFNDAVQRAARISYRLKFDGPTIVYSWPSAAKALGYEADSSTTQSSASRLSQMLVEIVDRTSSKDVYLIGHSMGTHILSDAIIRVAAQTRNLHAKAKEVILAAPDIDTQYFNEEISPKLVAIAQHITLYCSNNDTAISTSQRVHLEYSRVGDCRSKPIVMDGMDIIDATEANDSMIGHDYVAESNHVLSDMFYLIKNRLPARDRINLPRDGDTNSRRWIFKESEK